MDALLESTRGNLVCNSVQDVQDRLHRLLASRSSDTRAEHASFTFELRHNVVFHLNPDAENSPADSVVNPTEQSHHQPITQSVNAFETVQNQPSDDPILQRAVAKHIVGAMGIVDNSSWTIRKVSRDSQGWTFTYICKDSLQAWNRANAKNTEKHVIGSYSGPGSLDPINATRPAFDCRGTLTIAFSKSARGVIVKYDHTPIHKTVAQLVDLIALTLPPPPVNNGGTGSQRTPRAKRPPPAEGEEGSRKKRSRKKEKAPEAPMGGPPPGDGQNSQNIAESQGVIHGGVHVTSVPIVPPDEVKRRRETAIDLLNGRQIDPATLSEEQFNIFANQAPSLQTTSLDMLAKYGAERLRIVHPDDKDAKSTPIEEQSTNTTPATVSGQASAPGITETPTKKRRSRKKKSDGAVTEVSIGDGAVVSVQQSGEIGTTTSTLKLTTKKTRGSCETCRDRKLKCTKEHPSCSVCTTAEVECIYLPPKPRRKRAVVSGGEVVENEDSDLPGEREEFQAQMQSEEAPLPMPTTQMPVEYQAPAIAPATPDPDNEEFIPDPNILSGPVEHPPATMQPSIQPSTTQYYQNHTNSLTFSQNPQPSTGPTAMSTLTFPESQAREAQSESPNLVFPSTSHQTEHSSGSTFPRPAPATSQKAQNTPMSNRRSLPTTQNKQTPIPTPVPPPTIPQHAPNWNSPSTTRHATTASPTLTQQQTSRRSRSRKSDVEVRQQANDSMRQPLAVSQVAAQNQRQPSPATGSPYQTATRANSRQDHRSQTNTPVVSTSRPPPQAPQAAVSASYNTTASASIPSYDPYPRYDSTTNGQYNNANNDQGSTRIAYEPGSYQAHTAAITSASYSSAPAYDYPRTTSSSNPLSQALNSSSGYNNTSSSAATPQWPTSQARGSQAHAQPQANNTYPMASATTSTSNSYGTSSAESRTSHQNTPYTQSQPQSYNSYSAQQPSTNQQPQQSWYGFSANNNSSAGANQNSYSSNRNSGYGGTASSNQTAYSNHRPSASNYPGHSYGSGSDDQSIYELLRANGSTH
ncbi:uncharacterized protein F4817DRAFT_333740 [Daldinia loculata]|uniref:uncharacterized protein n=1 Tax=Daldinia loculata TaxID=103429 RepID=UPI0020C48024|nr:uncharacterized protein F4817DRAFT_333740 [Daldinia loculata]KAI1648685.1 hypothetical protein F4817DRAFT_333740 [Daldinia loculata]